MHPDPNFSKIRTTSRCNTFDRVKMAELTEKNDRLNPFNIDNEADIQQLCSGKTYHLPFLLMGESLQYSGKNLGYFWIRPFKGVDVLENDNSVVGFSSQPVQIFKLVENSAIWYNERDVMPSEVFHCQLSCPIKEEEKESRYPFCYNIEIKRSPIVASFPGHEAGIDSNLTVSSDFSEGPSIQPSSMTETLTIRTKDNQSAMSTIKSREDSATEHVHYEPDKETEKNNRRRMHGPVAYSLVIHPPIVITNFLPETVRFELMHATRGQVIWWKILEAGESMPIHTVGLDAPLLLLLNAGYCRTPIGEGVSFQPSTINFN